MLYDFCITEKAMSQENVEIVRRVAEAFNRSDVAAMVEEHDPDVEWHPAMQTSLGGEATVYRGHEGLRAMVRDFYEVFAEIHVDVSESETSVIAPC